MNATITTIYCATIWNDLPLHLASAPSLAAFKTTTQDLSVFPFLPRHYHMTRMLLLPFINTVRTPVVLAIINTSKMFTTMMMMTNNFSPCFYLLPVWCLCVFFSRFSELRIQFAQFDRDSDGVISQQELTEVMLSLGFKINSEAVKKILQRAGFDGRSCLICD